MDPHSNEVSLDTPIEGCADFKETLAKPQQLPESYTPSTVTDIIGVNNFNLYYSCVSCNKKVSPDQSLLIKYPSCNMK